MNIIKHISNHQFIYNIRTLEAYYVVDEDVLTGATYKVKDLNGGNVVGLNRKSTDRDLIKDNIYTLTIDELALIII